jgi:L-ascorbate metabolism protein UlaG (beta-lactamase superfamily)
MGEVKITLIGGPAALIEVGGFRLLIDPASGGNDQAQQHLNSLANIDALLLSHDRQASDVGRASRAMLAHAAWVLTTVAGATLLGAAAEGLDPWESRELYKPDGSAIRITATPAREGLAGIEPFAVDAIGFVITSPTDAFRPVYITGETTWYDGVAEVQRRFQPRLALLLAGDEAQPFCAVGDGAKASQTTSPPIMSPSHPNSWAYLPQQNDALDDDTAAPAAFGAELRKLSTGVTTSFRL